MNTFEENIAAIGQMIDDQNVTIARLTARCQRLSGKLREIAEFASERHDTVDGPSGEPMPNDWMHVTNIVERPS